MAVVTTKDFATEVKSDRLRILYISTLFIAFLVILGVLSFGFAIGMEGEAGVAIGLAGIVVIGASLITRFLLNRNQFDQAAWIYGFGWVIAAAILLYYGDERARQIIPFTFPIVIFLLGLLLPPISNFIMTSFIVIGLFLMVILSDVSMSVHLTMGIFLTILSSIVSAQATGELYQIAEWAIDNYSRERRTNQELFDKRNELQLSLKRSEILSEKLQDSNDELEVAREAAEEAKHFRGIFLANMSHELRTPLNAIIGFSETMLKFPMMYDDQPLPEAYQEDLSQIYDSGRQLLHVINDILDLARVDAGKLEIHMKSVKVIPLADASATLTKGLIGTKPIKIHKEIPHDLPQVWADESRLRQVLLNILSNSAKYTDEGNIWLKAEVLEDGESVQFSIRDSGIGIAPKYQATLFEEFQQADISGRDPRAGAGLGLAITKQLVELMDGNIWFESELGKGSTFYFTLETYRGQDENLPRVDDVTPLAERAIAEDRLSKTHPKRPKEFDEMVEKNRERLNIAEVVSAVKDTGTLDETVVKMRQEEIDES